MSLTMHVFRIIVVIVGCLAVASANGTKDTSFMNEERAVVKEMLERVNGSTYTRPVLSMNDTINVRLSFSLVNIVSVNVEESALVLNMWSRMIWDDAFLKWDPEEYGGIQKIRLPASEVWTPDIQIYNSARVGETSRANHFLFVYHNGMVYWPDELTTSAVCEMQVKNFPFDTQNCSLSLGSWSYSGTELDIEPNPTYLDRFMQSREWHLSVKDHKRNIKTYGSVSDFFVDVSYEFILERHSHYFQCVFIAPAIMIAFLTPTIFVMDHSEKFSIGAGMIVSLTILMEMLDEQIPGTHFDVPILARYYVGLFGMVCLGLILATITSSMRQKALLGTQPPSCLTVVLITVLGRVVCVKPTNYRTLTRASIVAMKQEGGTVDNGQDEGAVFDMSDRQTMVRTAPKNRSHLWTVMAIVLDRIFFLIYIAGLIVFTVTVVAH